LLVFRVVLVFAALVLGGLVIAWMVTRDRKYLAIAGQLMLWSLAFAVLLGLLYVFERVLLL
jgi:Na+-driven multidrug efflux pump